MKRLLASLAIVAVAVAPLAYSNVHAAAGPQFTYSKVCGNISPDLPHCFAWQQINNWSPDSSSPQGFNPPDLLSAYNLAAAAGSGGAGQTLVDVIWFDDPKAEADMNHYRAQFGIPACTSASGCFQKLNQNGQPSPLPQPNAGNAVETSLDLDMYSAICPNCKIVLIEASNGTNSDLSTAEDTAATLGTVISNSWGESDSQSNERQMDAHFHHPGVAITVSSGDSGYAAGPQWPAASHWITAVGGTHLVKASGTTRGWTESAWSGAGSGCSVAEQKARWQTDASCSKRTIADVSAVADPATGVSVYDSYQQPGWIVVGGTSVSAPLVAGVYALAGNASSVVFGSYPYGHTSSLNDVTSGNNGSCGGSYICTARPGYDGPTGLGTPNGTGAF